MNGVVDFHVLILYLRSSFASRMFLTASELGIQGGSGDNVGLLLHARDLAQEFLGSDSLAPLIFSANFYLNEYVLSARIFDVWT